MTAPTRDEVIKMAREAGTPDPMVFLAAYERLVAAAYARGVANEREACAKVAMEYRRGAGDPVCAEVAAAIRARNGK